MPLRWKGQPITRFTKGVRLVLGGLFVYASAGKIAQPEAFAQTMANYQILPPLQVNPAALLLPWIELVCSLRLLIGRLVRGSAIIVITLLIIFIGALGSALYRGLNIHCGCFSLDAGCATNLYGDIALDMVLLAAALWVLTQYWAPVCSITFTQSGHRF